MDSCINIKHPEFVSLAKQSNINPLILKSKVGVWQEQNNTNRFPTLKELGIKVEPTILARPAILTDVKSDKHNFSPETSKTLGGRLASSNLNSNTIQVRMDITKEEFEQYVRGFIDSPSSEQKKEVLRRLEAKGYTIEDMAENTFEIPAFLYLHEKSHLENKDQDTYWLDENEQTDRNLMSEKKIQIEFRATEDAIKKMKEIREANKKKSMTQKPASISIKGNFHASPVINIGVTPTSPINNEDNFISYRKYKLQLIEALKKNLRQYKNFNKNSSTTKEYKDKVREFNLAISNLENEVGKMDIKDATQVFHSIIDDINELYEIVEKMSPHDFAYYEIDKRIDNLLQLLTNKDILGNFHGHEYVDGSEFENFDKVLDGLLKLETLYNSSHKTITEETLKSNPVYQTNMGKMNQQEREEFEKGVQALGQSGQKDIGMIAGMFMGINSINDTIATTAINLALQFNLQKVQQTIAKAIDRLTHLDALLHGKNFNFNNFFLKDKFGVDTGYLVHIFSPEYFKELRKYQKIRKDLREASNTEKYKHYKDMMSWLKNNSEVIDFTKLRHFQDKYETKYPQYFQSSGTEMDLYEKELRRTLGRYYDIMIEELEEKLANFDEFREAQETSTSIYKDRNIMENSPWDFVKHYNSKDYRKLVPIQINGQDKKAMLQSPYITFIPKENINGTDLGYYSSQFNAINRDADAFNYWSTIRDIHNKHIDPVFSSMGYDTHMISYAKVQRSLEEIIFTKNEQPWTKKVFDELVRMYKDIWVDSRKVAVAGETVARNYTDTSRKAVNRLKELLGMKSTDALIQLAKDRNITIPVNSKRTELIDTLARYDALQMYSKDLTKITQAIAVAATEHRARLETAYLAETFKRFHKSIKTSNNLDRNNSNKRLEAWINTNIYNHRKVEDTLQEDLDSAKRFTKAYSKMDKELIKLIKEIQKDGPGGDTTFNYNDAVYTYTKGKYYVTTKVDDVDFTQIMTKDDFEQVLQQYLDDKIKTLGLPINMHSLWNGVLKMIIVKGLSFNPKSGVFNRIEGTLTNVIRDNAGDYWTPGNLAVAKNFMSFINLSRITDSRLTIGSKAKKLQTETFMKLFEKLGVYEDKKNELDRRDNVSRFNKIGSKLELLTFGLAVDLPEFKNQGEIVLSMLMDIKVKDVNGNEYPFFNPATMSFTLFEPGTLNVKPEFRTAENLGWETFELNAEADKNDFFVARVKIDDIIKKTQGNYSKLDSIQVQDNLLGRSLMTFMRWMPEHIFQRFGTRDFDVIQGKKKVVGRFAALYNNPSALGIYATFLSASVFGPTSVIPIAAVGGAVMPYILKMFNKNKITDKQMVLHGLSGKVAVGMLQEILIQTLNFPLKMAHSKFAINPLFKSASLESAENGDLQPEEVKAIKGLCQEIANNIAITMIMLGVKAMILNMISGDDDDDEEEVRRHSKDWDKVALSHFYNYVSNSGDRLITSFTAWASPNTFFTQNSKIAALRALDEVGKLINLTNDYFEGKKQGALPMINEINKALPFVPIPNPINDVIFKGQYPFFDLENYADSKWTEKMFLDPEKVAESKLNSERKLLKEDLIKEYESYYKDLYKDNPNITPQDISDYAEESTQEDIKETYKQKNETYEEAEARFKEVKEALEDRKIE